MLFKKKSWLSGNALDIFFLSSFFGYTDLNAISSNVHIWLWHNVFPKIEFSNIFNRRQGLLSMKTQEKKVFWVWLKTPQIFIKWVWDYKGGFPTPITVEKCNNLNFDTYHIFLEFSDSVPLGLVEGPLKCWSAQKTIFL